MLTSLAAYAALILLFCATPAGVILLCRKVPLLGKIGPIMVLYAIGIVIGNLPLIPEQISVLQEFIPNIVIPLAIPMMLYGCTFSGRDIRLQAKVVVSGFLSVALAVVVGYLACGDRLAEGAHIGGIITGMYTGGTLNAAALQTIFRINGETYVLINSYDILISFLYFVFLFSVGIPLFRTLYGKRSHTSPMSDADIAASESGDATSTSPQTRLVSKQGLVQAAKLLGTTLLIVALSAGVAMAMPEGWFMVVFILLLTTLGVAASFIRPIQRLDLGYDIGMYLIYIFSITIASMADFSNIDWTGGLNQIGFMSIAVFLSLLIHAVLCRVMGVDADSMMISSVAFINSPPFVPMASAAMCNKRALVVGLGAGIIGYAAGNHLGVLIAELLSLL